MILFLKNKMYYPVFYFRFKEDLSICFGSSKHILIPIEKVVESNVDDKYTFSERAVQGLKNSNKAFNKGRVQNLNAPSNTINSHLAKVSLNGTDPVLAIDIDKDIYRRFTPLEAARIRSFPDTFLFPVSEYQAYKQIGNAIPPVLMWHVTKEILKALLSATFSNTNIEIPEKGQSYEL